MIRREGDGFPERSVQKNAIAKALRPPKRDSRKLVTPLRNQRRVFFVAVKLFSADTAEVSAHGKSFVTKKTASFSPVDKGGCIGYNLSVKNAMTGTSSALIPAKRAPGGCKGERNGEERIQPNSGAPNA